MKKLNQFALVIHSFINPKNPEIIIAMFATRSSLTETEEQAIASARRLYNELKKKNDNSKYGNFINDNLHLEVYFTVYDYYETSDQLKIAKRELLNRDPSISILNTRF